LKQNYFKTWSFEFVSDFDIRISDFKSLKVSSRPQYFFLSFGFSIFPVGLLGTWPKKTFRGRL